MAKRWIGRVAVWMSRVGLSAMVLGCCVVAWVGCFLWSLAGGSWVAPVVSVVAAVAGVAAARSCRRAWLAREQLQRAAAIAVDREIAASLTDEALAWAVGAWRKRYL